MSIAAGRPEYVTDVAYVRAFENDLSPSRLRLVAALNGFVPPDGEDFEYCELGSAHGDTTATLAAAYPKARFLGVDLNREHIAAANALASSGQLRNVRFLQRDFEDLGREGLPSFDFIAAHGVLSWVGPTKRKAVIDFASAKLKPGGLVYVSYNALPGWAQIEPLRQLIVSRGDLAGGDSLARARAGLELARALSDNGAEYFTSNPAAKAMLKTMDRLGLPYVVHEYLHTHWVPMYFAQVAAEMAASDLYFVGQLPLYLNYRDLAIPASLAPQFSGPFDRITFESLKDFALNEYFRRDVYMKGARPRSDDATRAYLHASAFGNLPSRETASRDVRLPHHTLHYTGPIFDALLPALERGAATVTALASRPEMAELGPRPVADAIQRLLLGEHVAPMQQPTFALRTPVEGLLHMPLAFNRAVVRDALARGAPVALASTVAGTGIEISVVEAVAIVALTEVLPEDRPEWIRSVAARGEFRLLVKGQTVEGTDAKERVLRDEVELFRTTRLLGLLDLGVLTRA